MGFWKDLFDDLLDSGTDRKETADSIRSSDNSSRIFRNRNGDVFGVHNGEIKSADEDD